MIQVNKFFYIVQINDDFYIKVSLCTCETRIFRTYRDFLCLLFRMVIMR